MQLKNIYIFVSVVTKILFMGYLKIRVESLAQIPTLNQDRI